GASQPFAQTHADRIAAHRPLVPEAKLSAEMVSFVTGAHVKQTAAFRASNLVDDYLNWAQDKPGDRHVTLSEAFPRERNPELWAACRGDANSIAGDPALKARMVDAVAAHLVKSPDLMNPPPDRPFHGPGFFRDMSGFAQDIHKEHAPASYRTLRASILVD